MRTYLVTLDDLAAGGPADADDEKLPHQPDKDWMDVPNTTFVNDYMEAMDANLPLDEVAGRLRHGIHAGVPWGFLAPQSHDHQHT